MSESLDRLVQALKTADQRLTKPRRAVFRALQTGEPQSMRELIAACQTIDRATIYRTVQLFEHLGIVERIHTGWKYKLELSDQFVEHHHHLVCRVCQQVTALPEDDALERRLAALARRHQFLLENHQVELQGMCRDCQLRLHRGGVASR